jgi:DNA repair exonuclease SbcCD ATPase subunit
MTSWNAILEDFEKYEENIKKPDIEKENLEKEKKSREIERKEKEKKYYVEYHKTKKETVDKRLTEILRKIENIEEYISNTEANDSEGITLDFHGEKVCWSVKNIQTFINTVSDVAVMKLQLHLKTLPKDEQIRYMKLNKFKQFIECLKW